MKDLNPRHLMYNPHPYPLPTPINFNVLDMAFIIALLKANRF